MTFATLAGLSRLDVTSLRRSAPARTALMLDRQREAARDGRAYAIDQRWMPYDRISPLLRRAVLVAEDDAFFSHGGLDWNEIRAAARKNLEAGRVVRGGSTITQQLAKNLYLGEERTLTRKLREMVLAIRLERALPKRRIFELYLNEIEWGDGIFGAEAAARRYFGVSAADLDAREAVLLAAVIINPRRYSPLHPEGRIEWRARRIAERLHRRGALDDAQYARAIGGPPARGNWFERLFGIGRPQPAAPESAAPVPAAPAPESARGDSSARDSSARADSVSH